MKNKTLRDDLTDISNMDYSFKPNWNEIETPKICFSTKEQAQYFGDNYNKLLNESYSFKPKTKSWFNKMIDLIVIRFKEYIKNKKKLEILSII